MLTIHGRVQGVGFRYYVKQKADSLGISGFVKNQPDGSVYSEAEGEAEQLDLFIHFCQKGPSFARVDNVSIQHCPYQEMHGFVIK